MSQPISTFMSKAITCDGDAPQRSFNWATSRRALLKIFPDRFECGNWSIPFSEVTEATLYEIKQMFMPCHVLQINTKEKIYQFGLNPWTGIAKKLPIPFNEEKTKLKYSTYSIVMRVVAVALLCYWFFEKISK